MKAVDVLKTIEEINSNVPFQPYIEFEKNLMKWIKGNKFRAEVNGDSVDYYDDKDLIAVLLTKKGTLYVRIPESPPDGSQKSSLPTIRF